MGLGRSVRQRPFRTRSQQRTFEHLIVGIRRGIRSNRGPGQRHQHEQGNPAGSDAGGKVVGEAIQINGIGEVKLNPAALPLNAAAQKLPPRSPY